MTVIQRCWHRHIHTEIDRENMLNKMQKSAIPQDHINICIDCALNSCKELHFQPQVLCNSNLHQDLGIHSSYSKLLINKSVLNLKNLTVIFLSILNLMVRRIIRWKEKSEKGIWCDILSPYLLEYALWEGHQPEEHKPLHASFLAPSTQGSLGS